MRNVFAARSVFAVVLIALFFFVATCALAQQVSYLVTAPDSSLSVFDLASNNLLEKINQGTKDRVVAVGPNSRLAFVSSASFISVIDLTLGHEIQRIYNVLASIEGNSMAFTGDGRLLVGDSDYTSLDVIDAAALTVTRRVNLSAALGTGVYDVNTVLVVGSKAYVTSSFPDMNNPAIAVVDLTNYSVRSIAIPSGSVDFGAIETMPNAGLTPDGRYLVTAQFDYSDSAEHIMVISTLTGHIIADHTTSYETDGILVNPVANPANQYGYFIGLDLNNNFSVTAIDLRPGSQTFGQLLTSTEVALPYGFAIPSGAAVSADGTRIVIGQFKANNAGPLPDVFVIDTAKLLVDPSHAIIANATVPGNGGQGATIAAVTLQAPPTAPTVTGVSGNITNDTAHTIDVFGSNFASGAHVRIGSMAPLPANVISSTDVQVTVPANAPAAPVQDVVVTNPNLASPPTQQNQSGVLRGGLTISVNPNFQPSNQLATMNYADGSLSVYDFNQRAMTNIPLDPPANLFNVTFNGAGTDLYATSNGHRYASAAPEVLSLKVANDNLTTIPANGQLYRAYTGLVASHNPQGGGAVVYTWIPSPEYDLQIDMIDANPASPTFNTVLATFFGQLNTFTVIPFSGTATPDGKYVYVNFEDVGGSGFHIAIFDVVHGGPATVIDPETINAFIEQLDMVVTPDGQSLLLNGLYNGGIAVEDISQNPLNPTLVTTIPGSLGIPFLLSYQVVGNRLYALDVANNLLVAYNFDRQHSNFNRLGAYFFRGDFGGNPYIAVSPDGALLYVPLGGDDMVSIFDANKLASGQPPLITNLASFHSPAVVAVSPVSH